MPSEPPVTTQTLPLSRFIGFGSVRRARACRFGALDGRRRGVVLTCIKRPCPHRPARRTHPARPRAALCGTVSPIDPGSLAMVDDGSDEASTERVFAHDVDWHLQLLVEDANDFGMEVPITLFVSGAVITGILTSGKVYFEQFADKFAAGWPAEGRAEIRASMATPGEVYPLLLP